VKEKTGKLPSLNGHLGKEKEDIGMQGREGGKKKRFVAPTSVGQRGEEEKREDEGKGG